MNRYEIAYDMVSDIRQEVEFQLIDNSGYLESNAVRILPATYTLQDYLADKIAAIGETPENGDTEGITWEQIKEALQEYEVRQM